MGCNCGYLFMLFIYCLLTIIMMLDKIRCKLGKGTFGSVVECWDSNRKMYVAMKIVRSVKRYLDAAEIEISILEKLDEILVCELSLDEESMRRIRLEEVMLCLNLALFWQLS